MGDWREDKHSITDKLRHILTNSTGQDVQFIVGPLKRKILAHSFILNLISLQFEELINKNKQLDNEIGPIKSRVELPDVKTEAFKFILKNIYSDAPVEEMKPEMILDVWSAAKQFGMHYLAKNLEKLALTVDINIDNAIQFYNESIHMDMPHLEERSKDFILRNATKIVESPQFYNVKYGNLVQLVQNDNLFIDEVLLYQKCVCWAKEKCKRASVDSDDGAKLRNVLGNIVFLIRYPLMTTENFTLHVVSTNILLPQEVIDLYKYFSMHQSKIKNVVQLPIQNLMTFTFAERKCLPLTKEITDDKKCIPCVETKKSNNFLLTSKSFLEEIRPKKSNSVADNANCNFERPRAKILNIQHEPISYNFPVTNSPISMPSSVAVQLQASSPSALSENSIAPPIPVSKTSTSVAVPKTAITSTISGPSQTPISVPSLIPKTSADSSASTPPQVVSPSPISKTSTSPVSVPPTSKNSKASSVSKSSTASPVSAPPISNTSTASPIFVHPISITPVSPVSVTRISKTSVSTNYLPSKPAPVSSPDSKLVSRVPSSYLFTAATVEINNLAPCRESSPLQANSMSDNTYALSSLSSENQKKYCNSRSELHYTTKARGFLYDGTHRQPPNLTTVKPPNLLLENTISKSEHKMTHHKHIDGRNYHSFDRPLWQLSPIEQVVVMAIVAICLIMKWREIMFSH